VAVTGEGIVFLDKDGTLIEDLPYNVDPRRVRFAPGARRGVRMLAMNGWRMAVITNQSGVARGFATMDQVLALGPFLRRSLAAEGAVLAGFYACPHLPDGVNDYARECSCRKPEPGLVATAAAELGVDCSASWFVGDTWMDVAAGRAAGCRTIVVGPEWRTTGSWPEDRRPDAAVPDLLAAAHEIGARA
jgi:D-glycero-D-manno-heptose 1,7-bisphosphate phosphatase